MNPIRTSLTHDHRELDALLQRLSEDAMAPERAAPLQATWGQFETRLTTHMEAEERELLPLVEAAPLEVTHTLVEHAQIRQLVAELGIAIDLHAARQPAIEGLIKLLRAHALREDHVLYEFAGSKAPSAVYDKISSVLRAARSAIVGSGAALSDSHGSTGGNERTSCGHG